MRLYYWKAIHRKHRGGDRAGDEGGIPPVCDFVTRRRPWPFNLDSIIRLMLLSRVFVRRNKQWKQYALLPVGGYRRRRRRRPRFMM